MALYLMVFMGGTPFGSPLIGWIGEAFGARWSLIGGGGCPSSASCSASPSSARHGCSTAGWSSSREPCRGASAAPRSRCRLTP